VVVFEFHGEAERSGEAQKNLAPAFDLAEALFNFWLTQPKDDAIGKSALPTLGINLAMTLDVQACRLLRSVIEERQRSEGHNASILARSLFETVLGVGFLLKKDVLIIVEPILPKCMSSAPTAPSKFCAKASSKGVKRTRKHLLSREFWANLYFAHIFFELEGRGIESMGKFPGNKRKADKLKRSIDPGVVAEQEHKIGPEWSYILRHSRSYSGLSVEHLAKVLDKRLHRWYETVYHFQSLPVHAKDLLKHIDFSSDGNTAKPKFFSSDQEVYESLRTAITMFLLHVDLLHKNIGFGPDVETAYDSFRRMFARLSLTSP
jgi:hypothetical protein